MPSPFWYAHAIAEEARHCRTPGQRQTAETRFLHILARMRPLEELMVARALIQAGAHGSTPRAAAAGAGHRRGDGVAEQGRMSMIGHEQRLSAAVMYRWQ